MSDQTVVDRGLPRSHLRAAILVLVAPGPSHGYELLEQLPDAGLRNIDAGGLYRTLRAMERDGSLESWWEPSSSGPPRRTYMLTPIGRASLEDEIMAIQSTVELLTQLMDRAARAPGQR